MFKMWNGAKSGHLRCKALVSVLNKHFYLSTFSLQRHVDGVAQINMSDPEEADLVVQMMNRRFFGKRQLIAEIWDGKTRYK